MKMVLRTTYLVALAAISIANIGTTTSISLAPLNGGSSTRRLRSDSRQFQESELSEECIEGTKTIHQLFALSRASQEVEEWTALQHESLHTVDNDSEQDDNSTSICKQQDVAKTTCALDFSDTAVVAGNQSQVIRLQLEHACLQAPDAMYVEATYIYRCESQGQEFYYNAKSLPLCMAASCGKAGAEADQEQRARVFAENELLPMWETCEQVRLTITDPIMGESTSTSDQPASDIGSCEMETSLIEARIANETLGMDSQVLSQLSLFDGYCATADDELISSSTFWNCEVDYHNFTHTVDAICDSIGGLYLEVDTTISCGTPGEEAALTSPIDNNVEDDANNTISTTNFNNTREANLSSILMQLTVSHQPMCISKYSCGWDDLEVYQNSNAERWKETILLDQRAAGWQCHARVTRSEDFTASDSPTASPAPTSTVSPSSIPTISPAPTATVASSLPTVAGCFEESMRTATEDGVIAVELQRLEDILFPPSDESITLATYCTSSTDDPITKCELNYMAVSSQADEKNNTTGSPGTLLGPCKDQGGKYVEDTATIVCTGVEDGAQTSILISNRPACRSMKCNTAGVEEVAEYEFESTIQEQFEPSGQDYEAYGIMTGGQTCVIEELSVAVGGGGGGPVEPSQACEDGTASLGNIVGLFNSKITSQNQFLDYIDTDLRQICASLSTGVMECNFDWSEFLSGLQAECGTSMGQYVESSFVTECNKDGEGLLMTNTNVPGCVGLPCSPGESQYVLKADHGWLADKYIEDGWICDTEVLAVYAPNYDPEGSSQQEIIVDTEPGDDAGVADEFVPDPITADDSEPFVETTASPTSVPIVIDSDEEESSAAVNSLVALSVALNIGNIFVWTLLLVVPFNVPI